MTAKAGHNVKTCMDILLSDHSFDGNTKFKEICEFMRPTISKEFFSIDKSPQVIAFLLVSEVKDLFFGKRTHPIKKDLKKRLGLSVNSALWSITSEGSHKRLLQFKKLIHEYYETTIYKYKMTIQ